jgi:hypothetical protein
MGDVKAGLVDDASVVAKDVDVDLARAPALAGGAAELALDPFQGVQQRPRLERGLDLEDLVQELGLLSNTDRLRLIHA